jgi:hypothetical protein
MDYTTWRACERFNICPPGVVSNWDDNSVWAQAQLISYEQLRNYEEDDDKITLYKCLGAKI